MAKKNDPEYWVDRSVDRLLESEKLSEAYIVRTRELYKKAARDLQRQLDDVYKTFGKDMGLDRDALKQLLSQTETKGIWDALDKAGLSQYVKGNYKARITRIEKLQAQLYQRIKQVAKPEDLIGSELYSELMKNTYMRTMYDASMGSGYDFSFNKLDQRTIDKVLSSRWSGKNYSERIWTNTDILADKVANILGGAVASGQSLHKTASQLREAMGTARYYSERLIRTEANYVHNEAEYEAYKEMGIDRYIFVATLDMRTSSACRNKDGEVYELTKKSTGENYPPLHPNCRSTVRAYFGEEYEPLQRRARNPVTGRNELVSNKSYKEWYADQEERFGKQRIQIQEKKVQNLTADKRQHARYRDILGEEVPSKIDDFQELKYNKINDWNDLKGFYRHKLYNPKAERIHYEIKKDLVNNGIKGSIHVPAKEINTDNLKFDDEHINKLRNHRVTKEESIGFIKNSKISISKWDGMFENFYSYQGATYVNTEKHIIKTAYKPVEFDEKILKIMEVLRKYENG